ncbi:hypothetical protein CHCC14820_2518 [Bacillus paralicheniformis]|uniref:YciI family protein n=1 Tax=Bacillus paralicheniformis TaxID=1648923 RepID=A0A7Z0WVR5_9BACI|nr:MULTISPECIES: YciI family protein [Bacillus]ETB69367.1 hypothetical protein A943_18965 [Bacillus sp. CPSM8]KUL19088.1 hypothetical protein LI6934_02500 [Bacillus licheniformis LMG 6934]MBC8623443.1 hypothetical protein [Robertmurraya crescens]KFM91485.1 YCII-related domain protein [Bacillus paralicheniformis]MBG9881136.1 hypothetical protein [Bacillus paralicheniformis]
MKKYLLITTRTENFKDQYVPAHYQFLDRLKAENRLEMFGPFSDASGGAYLISAESLKEATEIGNSDPIVDSGSSTFVIKEWQIK